MKQYTLTATQRLPLTLDKAWAFFVDPRNLATITPSSLGFKIVSDVPEITYTGLTIEYTVKPLLGIPMKWVSLIKDVQAPNRFVDEQMVGPYAYWHHLHTFKSIEGGVEIGDVVTYSIPFGFLGEVIHPIIVRPQLDKIFAYRRQNLESLFGKFPQQS